MGNNPGKPKTDNFEKEGYQSSPRSTSSNKLIDDDEMIRSFRTPKASKRNDRREISRTEIGVG
jgi:hypothetical protein